MHLQLPRVVLIGETSVGKTLISYRLCDINVDETTPTISANFTLIKSHDNKNDIQLWDTAGTEKYRALNSVYYHNATGALLVFDRTNRSSFDNLESWINEFKSYALPAHEIVIVGNKSDMKGNIIVSDKEAEEWASNRNMKYFSVSALKKENISELKEYLLEKMNGKAESMVKGVDIVVKKKECKFC